MIELRKITWDNFEECLDLKVTDKQGDFVMPTVYNLAKSYVSLLNDELPHTAYAIYDDDVMVGFTTIGYETAEESDPGDEASYFINSFMIDKRYQNHGFGKQAMKKIIDLIKTYPQGKAEALYTSYHPNNEIVRKLYKSFGFVETGEIFETEVVAKLIL